MKTKQIFEAYNRPGKRADTLKFCPRCGARCDLISCATQSRLECPRCGFILYQNPSPGAVVLIVDDDMVKLEWSPLSEPFPAMAFEADKHIIDRYHKTKIAGIPVDTRFASL